MNTEDFVKHVVAFKKYQEMKAELNIMKSKLDNPEANTDIQEVDESIEVELETEDSDFNKSFNDDEESNDITFIKGTRVQQTLRR